MLVKQNSCIIPSNWKLLQSMHCHHMQNRCHQTDYMLSVKSQKGAINIQRCSIENHKGCYGCTTSMARAPFWFSMEHLWIVISALLALNWWRTFVKWLYPVNLLITRPMGPLNSWSFISGFCIYIAGKQTMKYKELVYLQSDTLL